MMRNCVCLRALQALNLSEEELAERTVDFIDIAVTEKTMFTRLIAKSAIDPSTYQSQKLGRGPLLPGWKDTFTPVMTAYKLVTVEAPYWGFGKRMEQMVLSVSVGRRLVPSVLPSTVSNFCLRWGSSGGQLRKGSLSQGRRVPYAARRTVRRIAR